MRFEIDKIGPMIFSKTLFFSSAKRFLDPRERIDALLSGKQISFQIIQKKRFVVLLIFSLLLMFVFEKRGHADQTPGTTTVTGSATGSTTEPANEMPGGEMSGASKEKTMSAPRPETPHPSISRPSIPRPMPGRSGQPFDIIYLPDDNGKLVPVLINVTLEQLYALQLQLFDIEQNNAPLFTIRNVEATGRIAGELAHLTIRLRIDTRREPVVIVPIGLQSGFFLTREDQTESQNLSSEGEGGCSLRVNPDKGGYDLILTHRKVPNSPSHSSPPPSPSQQEPASDSIPEQNKEAGQGETGQGESSPKETGNPDAGSENTNHDPQKQEPAETKSAETKNAGEHGTSVSDISDMVTHVVTLKLTFRTVQDNTGMFRLKAEFPPAVESVFRLDVPLPKAVATVVQGTGLVQTNALNEQTTRFVIQGLRNDFEIQWYKTPEKKVQTKSILQVDKGYVSARLQQGRVLFDAEIPVRSSSGPLGTFRIRLPENASYLPGAPTENPEAEILELPATQADQPKQVEIKLLKETDKLTVHLHAETPAAGPQDQWFELGGFEVLGAEKQFGQIAVIVSKKLQFKQKKGSDGIRPLDAAPVPDREEEYATTFEYFKQPFSLKVQPIDQTTRVSLRPEYQIQIERHQATLRGKFSYTIFGTPHDLNVDLAGWKLTSVEPVGMLDNGQVPFLEDRKVTFAFNDPVGKTVDVEIRAVQSIPPGAQTVQFAFPKPEADFIEPAYVSIIAADNLELNTGASQQKIAGLSRKLRKGTPLQLELPSRQQEPLVYQLDDISNGVFCADLIPHQQKITVQSQTEAHLFSENDPVVQSLAYRIEYEPVDRLILAVPRSFDEKGDWQVSLDGRLLASQTIMDASLQERFPNMALKRISLAETKIGMLSLTIRFPMTGRTGGDLASFPQNRTFPVDLPVVLPCDGTLTQTVVNMTAPNGVQIRLREDDSSWKKFDRNIVPAYTKVHGEAWQTDQTESQLPLYVSLENRELFGTTVIERSWVQTWLMPSGRTDHAVFQVASDRNLLSVTLPESVRPDTVFVKINDKKIVTSLTDRQLRIPLVASPLSSSGGGIAASGLQGTISNVGTLSNMLSGVLAGNNLRGTALVSLDEKPVYLVDLWYEANSDVSGNQLTFDLPQFASDVILRVMYWQMILPSNRHLLSVDSHWTPQFQWCRKGMTIARVSDLDQTELEDWVGVSHAEPVSAELNSYLFTALYPTLTCHVQVADRSTLVLISSGIVLFMGLVFLYFPKIRYSGIIFTLIVLLLSGVVYRFSIVPLFLQSGVLGVILTLMATFLFRMFPSRDFWGMNAKFVATPHAYSTELRVKSPEHPRRDSDFPATEGIVVTEGILTEMPSDGLVPHDHAQDHAMEPGMKTGNDEKEPREQVRTSNDFSEAPPRHSPLTDDRTDGRADSRADDKERMP